MPRREPGVRRPRREKEPPPPVHQWLMPPHPGYATFGVARIGVGEEVTTYFVREIPSELEPGQRAFELSKLTPGTEPEAREYTVLLDPEDRHTCGCEDFLRWSHCQHIDGLLDLLAELEAPPHLGNVR